MELWRPRLFRGSSNPTIGRGAGTPVGPVRAFGAPTAEHVRGERESAPVATWRNVLQNSTDRPQAASFTSEQRRAIRAALARRRRDEKAAPIPCPACAHDLSERPVPTPGALPYVRRRVWILCPACRRSAALDLTPPRAG